MIPQETPKRKPSHRDKIAQYLALHPGATNIDLVSNLWISNPSARLSEMREDGLIETVQCHEENRDGEVKHFCRYYLKGEHNGAF